MRAVLLHYSLPDVENLKAEVIVLHPGVHFLRSFQFIRLGSLPGAVIDGKVNMALLSEFTGSACVPLAHVAGAARGILSVKDKAPGLYVLESDSLENVLDDLVHVHCEHDPA